MSATVEIQLVAVVTAVAAALPGVYLVLRRLALVSDAISHAILPGIVVAFLLTGDLNSPLLVLAAAATGVLTVALIELLRRTRLVAEDAAIGLVFPALFSLGVILISRLASGVHLDTDAVLLGELAFVPFDRLELAGRDLGPAALWTMGAILLLNLLFILLLHKELKLVTVDPGLAALLGFSPVLLHYALMTMVSLTAVGAFNAVGSILVVALMIGPPAAAWLLVDRFGAMLGASAAFAAAGALAGYWGAHVLDVSIAGSMAVAVGVLFAGALLLAPGRGLLAQARRRSHQRLELGLDMLLVHLAQHVEPAERREATLTEHLRWSAAFTRRVARTAVERGLAQRTDGLLEVSPSGRRRSTAAVAGIGPGPRAA